jgi:acetoin utilization deacetylase AcuC-like enzyme/GNAT superfamily N-acetyltransferase
MFRIRRVFDDTTPGNKEAIDQSKEILRTQFPELSAKEVADLPHKLRNPLKYRFRSILFVADDSKGRISGFALLSHEATLRFCFLDFISSSKRINGRGVGGALYSRVRAEALSLNTLGLFFECLPDNPALSRNPKIRKRNIARLRFYERFGVFPIVNTAYETPVKPGGDNPPYLMYDNLGQGTELPLDATREIVRAILSRKYAKVCPEGYIDMVVDSFKDDPVQLRKPRYIKNFLPAPIQVLTPPDERIALVIYQKDITHDTELGYVEAPVKAEPILTELNKTDIFQEIPKRHFGEKRLEAVHDANYIAYLRQVCASLEPGKTIYPKVFPIRTVTRPPRVLTIRAGYYCVDTFTPIDHTVYEIATGVVDSALTAAKLVRDEEYRLAYALVGPPGHHAERHSFGGFCYFNAAAVAAQYLSEYGKVAVLDIDYHHGNGQQQIFYERPDVLTVSLHAKPSVAYPYFSGFITEKGQGDGEGFNINYPLAEKIDGDKYKLVLRKALTRIIRFKPRFLVVALGLDTASGDPTGTWSLQNGDFEDNGKMIGLTHLPTVIIQEGGYDIPAIGINARHFFSGLWAGAYEA